MIGQLTSVLYSNMGLLPAAHIVSGIMALVLLLCWLYARSLFQ